MRSTKLNLPIKLQISNLHLTLMNPVCSTRPKKFTFLKASKTTNGSTIIEFIVGGSLVLLILMGLIQMLLAYKASVQLQQATFEAARAGIVNNASRSAITTGFINNTIDLHGGGIDASSMLQSQLKATNAVQNPLTANGGALYELQILNPTLEAFDDWGVEQNGIRVIPNTWLHLQAPTPGATSGVSIQDANILKIEITYGYPLHIPIIGKLIGQALLQLDPKNALFYTAEPVRIPIKSTAVMHMQSPIYEDAPKARRRLN